MFSQYSWGDYIKFIILITALYYGFVGWKYYRQDILDWFGNLGKKDKPAPATSVDEEEEEIDDSGLYSVKNYSGNSVAPVVEDASDDAEPVEHKVPDAPVNKPNPEPRSAVQPAPIDVDISDGVVVADQATESFELGLGTTPVRPAERSLADVINAAKRMSADERGAFSPNNPDDDEAAELAGQLNQQKGFGNVLSGVSFNR